MSTAKSVKTLSMQKTRALTILVSVEFHSEREFGIYFTANVQICTQILVTEYKHKISEKPLQNILHSTTILEMFITDLFVLLDIGGKFMTAVKLFSPTFIIECKTIGEASYNKLVKV